MCIGFAERLCSHSNDWNSNQTDDRLSLFNSIEITQKKIKTETRSIIPSQTRQFGDTSSRLRFQSGRDTFE